MLVWRDAHIVSPLSNHALRILVKMADSAFRRAMVISYVNARGATQASCVRSRIPVSRAHATTVDSVFQPVKVILIPKSFF